MYFGPEFQQELCKAVLTFIIKEDISKRTVVFRFSRSRCISCISSLSEAKQCWRIFVPWSFQIRQKFIFMFKTTLTKGIFLPSLIFILLVSVISVLYPDATENALNLIKNFIFVNFNWVYVWAVTAFVIFLVYLLFSNFGNIRLGDNDSRPEHSFFFLDRHAFFRGNGNRIDVFWCGGTHAALYL